MFIDDRIEFVLFKLKQFLRCGIFSKKHPLLLIFCSYTGAGSFGTVVTAFALSQRL